MQNEVHDYTQTGSAVSQQEILLQKTYNLLGLSFLPCAAGAAVGAMFNPLAQLMGSGQWTGVIVFFAFFYGMCFLIEKNRYSNTGIGLLMVFTFGIGLLLGPILGMLGASETGSKIVGLAAVLTAAVFFTMAALARRMNFNTNALGNFLTMGGVVLMVGVVANLFLKLPVLALTLSAGFVLFSSLVIMWQIRNILEGGEDSPVSAALTLFISVYNIFLSLLRLLLAFAGSDE